MLFITTPCGMLCFVPINSVFWTFCVCSVYGFLLLLHIMRLQEHAGSVCNSSLTSVWSMPVVFVTPPWHLLWKDQQQPLWFVGHHEPCWGLDSSICNSSTFVVKGSSADGLLLSIMSLVGEHSSSICNSFRSVVKGSAADLLLSIMSLVGEHSSSICNSFTSVVKGSAADDLLLGSVAVVFLTLPWHLLLRDQQQTTCCCYMSWCTVASRMLCLKDGQHLEPCSF